MNTGLLTARRPFAFDAFDVGRSVLINTGLLTARRPFALDVGRSALINTGLQPGVVAEQGKSRFNGFPRLPPEPESR